MNKKNQLKILNELFGWIEITLKDNDGNERQVKIKYTLGSMMDVAEAGINLNDENQLSDPETLAKLIYYGLPQDAQEGTSPKDIAYQIDLESLMEASGKVEQALESANPGLMDKGKVKAASGSAKKK